MGRYGKNKHHAPKKHQEKGHTELYAQLNVLIEEYQNYLECNVLELEKPDRYLILSTSFLSYLKGEKCSSIYRGKTKESICVNEDLIDSKKMPEFTYQWPEHYNHLNYILDSEITGKDIEIISESVWDEIIEYGFKGHKIFHKFSRYEGNTFSESFPYIDNETSYIRIIEIPLYQDLEDVCQNLDYYYLQVEDTMVMEDVMNVIKEKSAHEMQSSKENIILETYMLDTRYLGKDHVEYLKEELSNIKDKMNLKFKGYPLENDYVAKEDINIYKHMNYHHMLLVIKNLLVGQEKFMPLVCQPYLEEKPKHVFCERCTDEFKYLEYHCKCMKVFYCSTYCKYKDLPFHLKSCKLSREITIEDGCYESVVHLENNHTEPRGIVGFRNLGNSCYINSIMQAFMNSNLFWKKFTNNFPEIKLLAKQDHKLVTYFLLEMYEKYWSSQFKSIECWLFKTCIGLSIDDMFLGFRQNDAHELFLNLLEGISKEKVDSFSLQFSQHFQGKFKFSYLCENGCKKEGTSYDEFTHLSLAIPKKKYEKKFEFCLIQYDWNKKVDILTFTFDNSTTMLELCEWISKSNNIDLDLLHPLLFNKTQIEDFIEINHSTKIDFIVSKTSTAGTILGVYVLNEKYIKEEHFLAKIITNQNFQTMHGMINTMNIGIPRIVLLKKNSLAVHLYGILTKQYISAVSKKDNVFDSKWDELIEMSKITENFTKKPTFSTSDNNPIPLSNQTNPPTNNTTTALPSNNQNLNQSQEKYSQSTIKPTGQVNSKNETSKQTEDSLNKKMDHTQNQVNEPKKRKKKKAWVDECDEDNDPDLKQALAMSMLEANAQTISQPEKINQNIVADAKPTEILAKQEANQSEALKNKQPISTSINQSQPEKQIHNPPPNSQKQEITKQSVNVQPNVTKKKKKLTRKTWGNDDEEPKKETSSTTTETTNISIISNTTQNNSNIPITSQTKNTVNEDKITQSLVNDSKRDVNLQDQKSNLTENDSQTDKKLNPQANTEIPPIESSSYNKSSYNSKKNKTYHKFIPNFEDLLLFALWNVNTLQHKNNYIKKSWEKLEESTAEMISYFEEAPFVLKMKPDRGKTKCPACKTKNCSQCQLKIDLEIPLEEYFSYSESAFFELSVSSLLREYFTLDFLKEVSFGIFDEKKRVGQLIETSVEVKIEECFDNFTQAENLLCTVCNVDSYVKRVSISEFPQCLVIHLNRFESMVNKNSKKQVQKKNENLISFGTSLQIENIEYLLYGVVNHEGSMESGHYFSYCKNPNGNWYNFNDDKVMMIQESSVCTRNAYILFYEIKKENI